MPGITKQFLEVHRVCTENECSGIDYG